MPSMGYQPALDGLRALSVIAVIFYHAGFSWMHGGFFGVEVFFVVSGFLITSLLLDERDRSGHTNLAQFWLRRARRLLPALFTVLAAVAVWSIVDGTDEQQSQLRRDLPWATFYGGNWGQIVGGVPYYSGDPPLLRHVWSLAVEEHWYLFWPLAFIALRRTRLTRAGTAGILVALSVAVMVWTYVLHGNGPGNLSSPITVFDDVDRINFMYLSTVTRASGIVLGAAAAFVWRPWRSPAAARSRAGWLLDGFGLLAVAMLGCIAAVATLTDGYVYQWLLALVTFLSLVAVLVAVHPAATWFRAILSWTPLVEIGKRSYGIYLWHWPIFVFADAYGGSVSRVVAALARDRRRLGAVLPLRRDAGAPRRARPLVAYGEGATARADRRDGLARRRSRRLLLLGRSVRPGRRRGRCHLWGDRRWRWTTDDDCRRGQCRADDDGRGAGSPIGGPCRRLSSACPGHQPSGWDRRHVRRH